MKKNIVIALCVLVLTVIISSAVYFYIGYKDSKKEINLDGKIFSLKYSDCSRLSETCINKYYKEEELDDDWSDMISIVYIKPISDPHLYSSFVKREKNARMLKQEKDYDILTFMTPYMHNNDKYIEQTTSKVMQTDDAKSVVVMQISSRYIDPMKYLKQKDVKKAAKQLQKMYAEQQTQVKFLTSVKAPNIYFRSLKTW